MFNVPCQVCGKQVATQRHHKFSQTKRARKVYGKLLDEVFNIVRVCADCHTSHAHIPDNMIWSEREFRENASARGFKLPEPLKSYKGD